MQGVNESMFGQQQREQSGFAMQYATNQGNMIRQRLFNKYVRATEHLYRRFLLIVANKWKTTKIVQVVGRENDINTLKFKGSDIAHGYDVTSEFGRSLSLDPMTRRGELMNMMPLMEKAQVPPQRILAEMQLGETDAVFDDAELGQDRMLDYFDRIIKTGVQAEPRPHENHEQMLSYASKFVMLRAYQSLEDPIKDLIDEHIKMRQEALQQAVAPQQAAPGMAPPAPGAPGEEAPAEGEGGEVLDLAALQM
jgi:hypothetical protein